jgi:hypothetical protein
MAAQIVRCLLAVAPSWYRGSTFTSTFLVRTNCPRNPFAEALSRVSSLAMAASSATSIAVDGVLFSAA